MRYRAASRGLCVLVLMAAAVTCAAQTAQPIGTVPVGDSPFALSLTPDQTQAIVVNLFPTRNPDGSEGPNVRVLNVVNYTQVREFRAGTRLVSITTVGNLALVVNEDQDVVRVIDITTGREVGTGIAVGSRPSSVIAIDANTALVTNGTSGDISFIDLRTNRTTTVPAVGTDPRAAAVHPNGRYAYVTLGGEGRLAIIDLATARASGAPISALAASIVADVPKVSVGKNPVAIQVSADGTKGAVANLTKNTVTILDLTNPADPKVLTTVAVGVQPTSLAFDTQTPNKLIVANLGSPFFTVVDVTKRGKDAVLGVVQMGTPSSAVVTTRDGKLLITEFKTGASLRSYSLGNMPLTPLPPVDIPGEPRLVTNLRSTGDCASSFYITEAGLAPGEAEGFWGMEVLVSQGELTGGFNLGGAFEGNNQLPGFGAFSLARAQRVDIRVEAQQFPGTTGSVGLDVSLLRDGTTRVGGTSGAPPLSFSADLQPGFYVVRINSVAGSPRGTFQMALSAQGFSGGVVVGGFITGSVPGFGAFCVPQTQNVDMKLVGLLEYGAAAAGDLILTLKDINRNVLRVVNNSVSAAPPVAPPAAPSTTGLNIRYYVDAAAAAGGDGSSARPFRSISTAIARASQGEVIFVRAGRYSPARTGETIPIGSQGTGTAGLRPGVQVIGAGAATTIIDAENFIRPGDSAGNAVVIPSAGVRFAGFTVRGAAQVGVYVFRAANVVIENNLFTGNARFGTGAEGSNGIIVRNNVAVGNRESGIAISGGSAVAVSGAPANCPSGSYSSYVVNNVATDNRADGILLSQGGTGCVANNITNNNGSSGIELNNRDASSPLSGVIINNELSNNGGVQFGFAGTGILVTEGATGSLIQGNKLINNRPFGIGIFENGRATTISRNIVSDSQTNGILVQRTSTVDEISDNEVRNTGSSALFLDNRGTVTRILRNVATGNGYGLSVLDNSTATTVEGNTLDANGVGSEIAISSRVTTFNNNSLGDNARGGLLVRENSTLTTFSNNRVRSSGAEGVQVNGSTATFTGSEISSNRASGFSIFSNANVTIQNCQINLNSASGIFATSGSQVTVSGTTVNGNSQQGVLSADAGTTVRLTGGNSVTNTNGYGLNAQNGGAISCSGSNALSGNSSGNTLGNVSGCQ